MWRATNTMCHHTRASRPSALEESTLAFYAQPGVMTSAGRYAPLLDPLRDVAGLAAVGQGLVVHEHMAAAYGVTLSDDDRNTVHLRPVEQLLEQIIAGDPRPLDAARVELGVSAGNCRHFTVLTVAMFRAQGTPAPCAVRLRCVLPQRPVRGPLGVRVLDDAEECWRLVDAQIDAGQRSYFGIDFDLTDVPRDQFLSPVTPGRGTAAVCRR